MLSAIFAVLRRIFVNYVLPVLEQLAMNVFALLLEGVDVLLSTGRAKHWVRREDFAQQA